MHKFTPDSVDQYLTPEALESLNVDIPGNHGHYPSEKEFDNVSEEEKSLAQSILSSVSKIMANNELPNIKSDDH